MSEVSNKSPATQFFETHFHLDYLKSLDQDSMVKLALDTNISKMITISVSPNNFNTVVELANKYEAVYCSQGIHPHEAKDYTTVLEKQIIENVKNNSKIVAIGEIGLDYYYNNSPHDKQRDVFEKQLQLSIDLDLPVIIHTRDADEDCKKILSNFAGKLKKGGVVHSFTSSIELAEFSLNFGFFIGFNGIITFKNAENVRDVLRATPKEKILFETDAPFLTPVPHRGKENNPSYLPFVAAKICEVKNVTKEELYPLVYENSCRLFQVC